MPSLRTTMLFVTCWLVAVASSSRSAADEPPGFLLVAHPSVQAEAIDRDDLARLFLKKNDRLADGSPVVVFDLPDDSPVRDAFTRSVHGKRVAVIENYWQRMTFGGRHQRPLQLRQDEVLRQVAETPGALAYVAGGLELPPGVRVIRVAGLHQTVSLAQVVTSARELLEIEDGEACGSDRAGVEKILFNRGLARSVWARVKVANAVPGRTWDSFQKPTLAPSERLLLGCTRDGKLSKSFTIQAAELR